MCGHSSFYTFGEYLAPNVMDCDIVTSEYEPQMCNCVH